MSFLPESVTTDLERLILSVRPQETRKLVSIVSKHLTQVVTIAFPRPPTAAKPPASVAANKTEKTEDGKKNDASNNNENNSSKEMTEKGGEGDENKQQQSDNEDEKSEQEKAAAALTSPAGGGPPLGGYDSRARSAVELLCACATCEFLDSGARDVARAVLKLIHKDNISRLRGSNLAVARFSRVLLEAYTEDYEAVTTAIDDSFMENSDGVGIWLAMVAKHPQFGDLILQLWGNALSPSSAIAAHHGMFAIPWIKQQAHSKLIDMLAAAIKNEEELPLFTFVQEIFQRGLNAHVGHFVDHILLGNSGEGFIDAVIKSAEGVADGTHAHSSSPCLPEALALLSSMLSMLQRSSFSQTCFSGDYNRTLKTNAAVQTFIQRLPRLSNLLNSDALAARVGAFGSARLRIVDACMTLFRFNRFDSDQALFDVNFISQLFALCESFPNHDVVLAALAEICTEAIVRTHDEGKLEKYLIDECHLHDKLIAWVKDEKFASTSLCALALTVSFGLAQKGIKDVEEEGDDNENDEAEKLSSLEGENNNNSEEGDEKKKTKNEDDKNEEEKKKEDNDDDDDEDYDPLDSPELRKQNNKNNNNNSEKDKKETASASAVDGKSPSSSPLSQISPEVIEKSSKLANASPEWKEFIASELPGIWKQWFTEITGYFFQEPKSGGGKQVMHRPVVNLTRQSKNSNRYFDATVGKNGVDSNKGGSSNNSSAGGSSSAIGTSSDDGGESVEGNNSNGINGSEEDEDSLEKKMNRLLTEGRNEAQSKRRAAAAAARRQARSGNMTAYQLDTVVDVENGNKIISTKSSSSSASDGNNNDEYSSGAASHHPEEHHIVASPTDEELNMDGIGKRKFPPYQQVPPRVIDRANNNNAVIGDADDVANMDDLDDFDDDDVNHQLRELEKQIKNKNKKDDLDDNVNIGDVDDDVNNNNNADQEQQQVAPPVPVPRPKPGGKRLHRRTHSGHQDPMEFSVDAPNGNSNNNNNDESVVTPSGKNAANRYLAASNNIPSHQKHADPMAAMNGHNNDEDELQLDLDDVQPIAHSEEDNHQINSNDNMDGHQQQQGQDDGDHNNNEEDAWVEKFITEVDQEEQEGENNNNNNNDDEELEIDLEVDEDNHNTNNIKDSSSSSSSSSLPSSSSKNEPVIVTSSGTLRNNNNNEEDDDDW